MAATPQYGQLTLVMQGVTRTVDIYHSDVANARINLDDGNGASSTSSNQYPAPAAGYIVDYTIVTGAQDTTKLAITVNGRKTGDHLRYTLFLTTLATRPSLRIPFRKNDQIGGLQIA